MILTQRTDVRSRELPNGEAALMTPDDEVLILLNPLGVVVWEMCDGECAVDEIVATLATQFTSVDVAQIGEDVARLVGELQRLGVLEAG